MYGKNMEPCVWKSVSLVYFTGTGGTGRAALCLVKSLEKRDVKVNITELTRGKYNSDADDDLLILLFPVHAANAPLPVYEWIESAAVINNKPAVVISVSGGGEISPNTACRSGCIKRLEKKGYEVIYESMLIMPSNWIVPTPDGISARLLKILPVKIDGILNDIFSGIRYRSRPIFIDKILSTVFELEKMGAKTFGRKIRSNSNCTGCGWCERNCPRENIKLINGRPVFDSYCVMCLRCIYGCPYKALKPGMLKFIHIKNGIVIQDIEKRMESIIPQPVDESAKGYLWKGVREYLKDYNIQ